MKFEIKKGDLKDVLGVALKFKGSRSPIAAMNGYFVEARKGALEVITSTADASLRIVLKDASGAFEVEEEGAAVFPDRLKSVVDRSEGERVRISGGAPVAKLGAGRSSYKLAVLPGSDYPRVAFDEASISMKTEDLISVIESTSFSAGVSENRPILTGVKLQHADGRLSAVATDSYRLAESEAKIDTDAEGAGIIPAKPLKNVSVFESFERVKISLTEKALLISAEDEDAVVTLKIRGIEGTYPATDRVINAAVTGTDSFTADTAQLSAALSRASLFSEAQDHRVVTFTFGDEVTLSSHAQEIGASKEDLEGEYTGENLKISLDSRYMQEALKHIDSEKVTIKLTAPMRPIYIYSGADDARSSYVILPVRVS